MKNKNYQEIIEYFKKVKSTVKTAEKFGYSNSGIHKILNRFGLKGLDRSESKRKFNFNENFFEIIDTEEKAYWLGFLYADGYVSKKENKITLTLSKKDINHIIKFNNCLNSNYNIKTRIINTGPFKGKEIATLLLTSSKMKEDLIKHGCFNCKSLILKFPTTVPDHLINHFIRGYFDGDGSVFISNERHHRSKKIDPIIHVRILGTYDLLSILVKHLNFSENTIHSLKGYNINIKDFRVKRKIRCKQIMEYLYKNSTIYLDRKKQIFDNYFK